MDIVKKIADSDTLLDILIQAEDFLDSMDLYAFKNWIDGTVVDGPYVSRYWVVFSLMYDYNNMPDPAGAIRLINIGAKVDYKEIKLENTDLPTDPDQRINIDNLDDMSSNEAALGTTLYQYASTRRKKYDKKWIVTITIPRQFIDDLNDINMNTFDTDVQNSLDQEYKLANNNVDSQAPTPAETPEDSGDFSIDDL